MRWAESPPIIKPKAVWTKEEDKELLALDKKYYGRWKDVPYKWSHTPHECNVRILELKATHTIRPKITVINESQLVSKAHEEAENSVIESDSAQFGIPVAAANSAAVEATPGIDTRTTISLKNTLESVFNISLDDQANDTAIIKLRECEEKVVELRKEKDQLVEQRDSAIKKAQLRRTKLGKARDRVAILEADVVRAEKKARIAEIDVEAKVKEQREAASLLEKQFLLAYIYALQAEFQRTNTQQQIGTMEVDLLKDTSPDIRDAHSLTKPVE